MRLLFLVPFVVIIIATVAVLVAIIFEREQRDVRVGVLHLRTSAAEIYEHSVEHDARVLTTLMDVLAHDETLKAGLERKDRQMLLARARPMFDGMKHDYGITHFYFTGPDRVNLLRVHEPDRHGDVIDRVTTLLAERRGVPTYGVELGPLGSFTLRLVAPWRDERTGELTGYVELGVEINNVLDNMSKVFGADIFVLIKKEFLDRKSWEDGMRTLGRVPEWDRFPNVVISTPVLDIPAPLIDEMGHGQVKSTITAPDLLLGRNPSQPLFLPLQVHPLQDVSGRAVAEMVLLVDMSKDFDDARHEAFLGAMVTSLGGVALLVLFYRLVGRIGKRIERDEQALQELASHDGLTKLYNYRMYCSILEAEIARARRYGHSVSLLMLDIDRFKRINDTYGHIAGDRILEGLARLLQRSARRMDSVCRCGGEEIGVILPEVDARAAIQAAERLRTEVERTAFDLGNGEHIKITVSIGVAALPEQATSLPELAMFADKALYVAKESGRNRVHLYGKPTLSDASSVTRPKVAGAESIGQAHKLPSCAPGGLA